ncbi:MAG: thioredoxin domain-containing protein [Rhodospirillales bacterium]
MLTTRRSLLSLVATGTMLGALSAHAEDPTRTDRIVGSADAKTTVIECFSLTCSHCAAFAKETLPQVKTELIATGKIRYQFLDFPLNGLDFIAFQVTRYMPTERYMPFVEALLATQDRWAFARGINPTEELWKMAALAGMSRTTFDKAVADTALKTWIAEQQDVASKRWKVDSTPTFIVNGAVHAGQMSFDAFRKLIPES